MDMMTNTHLKNFKLQYPVPPNNQEGEDEYNRACEEIGKAREVYDGEATRLKATSEIAKKILNIMATLAVGKKEFTSKDLEKCLPAKVESLMKQESKKSLIYFVIASNIPSMRKLHPNHSERAGKKFLLELIGKLALRMNSICNAHFMHENDLEMLSDVNGLRRPL